jgi:2-methylcitrate dehydratase PrpD
MVKAAYCVLDFLSCANATQHFSWVEQARQVAINNSGIEPGSSTVAAGCSGATLIGSTQQVSLQDAVFVNSVAGHSLVRDDMHLGSVSHLGVAVIPVALALAEQNKVSSKQLLEAIICGYEAGARLGAMLMDVETARTFRPTGLIGAFAAAATAAKLNNLDTEASANALGFATNYITGLNEWAAWGSDDMYFHPGIAARNGLTAAQLAQAGAQAAQGSLDGKAGLFAAFAKAVPTPPALPFSDPDEEILRVFFKQVPACNYAQTAAQVAVRVKTEHAIAADAITKVCINVPYAAAHYPGCDYPGPFTSILQARMSIHFNVASALLYGDFDDNHYQAFASEEVRILAGLVSVTVDGTLTENYPAMQGASIEVATQNDENFSASLADVVPADLAQVMSRYQRAAAGKPVAEPHHLLLQELNKAFFLESLIINDDQTP